VATVIWKGDAAAVAQATVCTVGGTIEADQNFTITIGSKSLNVVAVATTASGVVARIVAAWNALSPTAYPEYSGITIVDNLNGTFTLTGTPGVPFVVTLVTTEADGSPSDSETFTQSTPTAASGPAFWSEKQNWSTGAVPAGGDDVVIQNSSAGILYGLDQQSVTLASLSIDQSFTGTIGLARTNPSGYVEYRGTYLQIKATTVTIGAGSGAGSGRIKLDTGSGQCAIQVHNSGSPAEQGVKSILWKGTHASNTVTVNKGSFGAAVFAGEAATIATLKQGFRTNVAGDSDVLLGGGCTLTTITKTGGSLEVNSGFTTLAHSAGETVIAAGTPATLSITGGAVRYKTAGTYTQASVASGGELDFRQDLRPRTGTNTALSAGAVLRDPAKTVTFTNPIALACTLDDVTLDLGANINLQRS
jgi:hypothetical protein